MSGKRHQEIQDAPAGEADAEGTAVECVQGVAHPRDDLGVGDLGGNAHGVEVELRELAEAPRARLVRAPHRPHLIAAEGTGQFGILGDQPRKRHGEIEAQAERIVLRALDAEDGSRRLGAAGAREDAEVLDGRGGDGHEAVELVHALDRRDHALTGDHLARQKIAEAAGKRGLDRFHGWRGACRVTPAQEKVGTDARDRTEDLLIHNQAL